VLIGGDELLTKQQTIDLEQRVIGAAREGIAATVPIMDGKLLAARVQEKATELGLRRLNPGQLGAAVGILSSTNRVELVQGGAGVGKSAALMPVAALAREAGHQTIALAHVGRIAREFGEKTGSPASTVDQFLARYRGVLNGGASPEQMAEARSALSGSVLLVDEASQIGDARLLRLIQLANRMDVARVVLAGDIKQLPAIEAGKPFANLQKAEISTSGITENLRAQTRRCRT
jgi:ATP-dependent exoDNAse (exonuclease V) alpha subunit